MITSTDYSCYRDLMNLSSVDDIIGYNFRLSRDTIDLWQFSLDLLPCNISSLLNEEETTRANRFHFERHKRRFMVARATTRLILSRYLNVSPQALLFTYNQYGKPFLENDPTLTFNISHSRDLALLAVGKFHPLGVDIEYFSARPYLGIGKHLFSEQELRELSLLPDKFTPYGFFRLWSQKEAFIKAVGMGLSYPTADFTVPCLPSENNDIKDNMHDTHWRMHTFMPKSACCGALCYHPSIDYLRILTIKNIEDFYEAIYTH